MSEEKWDFNSLREHKMAIKYQCQSDIDKLDHALGLLTEVNETFTQAFHDSLDKMEKSPSTGTTAGTVPMKLARSISEIKGIKSALEYFRERM